MYLTFHGEERFKVVDQHAHAHDGDQHELPPGVLAHAPKESPWVVTVPLIALAIPSILIGYFTIDPVLYGDWFGSAIRVADGEQRAG